MAAAAFLIAGARAGAFGLSPGFTLQMILWSVVLSFVDTRRRGERALLGNLGVHPATLGALFAGAAIIGEGTLWLAGAVLR